MSSFEENSSDPINDLTAALGQTHISDNPPETEQGTVNETGDVHQENALASAAEGRRLYIGNISYTTTEKDLEEFFTGYSIESVTIPKSPRTDRPVGFAFVDLLSSSEAERAIAELSGKKIIGRQVSVQLARKSELSTEKSGVTGGEGPSGGEGETVRRRPPYRGRSRRGGRSSRGARNIPVTNHVDAPPTDDVPPITEISENQGTTELKETKESRDIKETKDRKDTKESKETKEAKKSKGLKEKPARFQREKRVRGPPADGIPSKTKIMVANIPYKLTEEKLEEIFAEYKPITTKIALRPIPRFMVKKLQARNEQRKGRGFGFINLASNELQCRAVKEMNGKVIEGREIAVKIAIDSPDKILEDANTKTNTETVEDTVKATNGSTQTYDTNHSTYYEGTSNGVQTYDTNDTNDATYFESTNHEVQTEKGVNGIDKTYVDTV